MYFDELVQKRRSVRSYLSDPVREEYLTACLAAARLAPSACNAQPWHFIVALLAKRPTISSRIGGFLKGKPFELIDVGIAAEHFCRAAADRGLGTCMLGWFDGQKVKRLLSIPGHVRVALLIMTGYPADAERAKRRKSITEVLSRESYNGTW